MSDDELVPYRMATQRFAHACRELEDISQPVRDCLINAIIALSPLRDEDMPPDCQVAYEQLKHLVGESVWEPDATATALAKAMDALTVQQSKRAVRLIVSGQEALAEHPTALHDDSPESSSCEPS